MEQKSGKSARALAAGYEAGGCERTGDAPETQEELKEKSLSKNRAGQSSISEKLMTADEKFSEEGVQDELSGTSLMSKFVFRLRQQLFKSLRLNQLLNRSRVYDSNTKDEAVERGSGRNFRSQSIPWYVTDHCSLSFPNPPSFSKMSPRYDFMASYLDKHCLAGHGSTLRSGERLTQGECGIPLQSKRKPGGDFSAEEEMLPPGPARNYSTDDSLLVNSHLQQPSDSFRRGIGVCYLPSDQVPSMRQIALAKTFTLSEFYRYTSLLCRGSSTSSPVHTNTYPQPLSLVLPPPSLSYLSSQPWEGNSRCHRVRRKIKCGKDSPGVASTIDSSEYMLAQPRVREKGRRIDCLLGVDQDNNPDSTVCAEESGGQDAFELLSLQCESVSGGDSGALIEMEKENNMRKKTNDKDSPGVASTADSSDYTLDRPPPGPLRETGLIKTPSTAADAPPGHSQDNTRETQLHATAGPSALQPFTKGDDDSDSAEEERVESSGSTDHGLSMTPDQEYGGDLPPEVTQLLLDSVALNQFSPPQDTDADCITCKDSSTVYTAGRRENINELSSVQSECEAGDDDDALEPGSSCLPRSHSVPSLSQISSAENKIFRPSESLPDLLLKSSFEEFTPDITVGENDETYRFLCSCPGLYQCSVTGLVFHMEGEADVVYRIVSWDRRLLAQHHKKPAGPLFDIKCLQQSVCRLHLPHCEIRSTAGCGFLSVAHVKDESVEFIPPHKITETHVIINITGFSGFGNVKDEDSPPEPVRALVLLFYRPPDDQDLESLLNVLMLPSNVVLQNVQRTRKINVGDELYIETSSHCKLLPKQEYTLSTCPEDDSVLVQPTTAEFDCGNYDNYFTSFQVDLEKILKHIKLSLRDTNRHSFWERRVCLSSAGLKKSCGQSALNLPPNKRLFDVRSSFIEGISGPVLKSLLDKLFEKKVLTDAERESADVEHNRGDKARFVIDTVRRKGDAASSEMIEFLCELDPFLCEHLGLI